MVVWRAGISTEGLDLHIVDRLFLPLPFFSFPLYLTQTRWIGHFATAQLKERKKRIPGRCSSFSETEKKRFNLTALMRERYSICKEAERGNALWGSRGVDLIVIPPFVFFSHWYNRSFFVLPWFFVLFVTLLFCHCEKGFVDMDALIPLITLRIIELKTGSWSDRFLFKYWLEQYLASFFRDHQFLSAWHLPHSFRFVGLWYISVPLHAWAFQVASMDIR